MDVSSNDDEDFELVVSGGDSETDTTKNYTDSQRLYDNDERMQDIREHAQDSSIIDDQIATCSRYDQLGPYDEESRDSLRSLQNGWNNMNISTFDCNSNQEPFAANNLEDPEEVVATLSSEGINTSSQSSNDGSQSSLDEDRVNHQMPSNSHGERLKRRRINERLKKLSRKRRRIESDWEKWKRKRAVNTGSEYKPKGSDRKSINKRRMKPCCNCKSQCSSKLPKSERENCRFHFWNLGNHEQQWQYVLRHVKEKELDSGLRKKRSRIYELNGVRVCKVMFMNTLGISGKFVNTALKKARNKSEAIVDRRGRNRGTKDNLNKVRTELRASVVKHINLFPRIESHYARKDSNKEYLSSELSLNKMYKLYETWSLKKYGTSASKWVYSDVFNTEFNISFYKPKKDLCNLCEQYKNSSPDEKRNLQKKYDDHISNKLKVRELKEVDSLIAKQPQNTYISVACFDLEKVLSYPKAETNALHYLSKFHTYNETIYDVGKHKGYCYVWPEHEAKRGSDETASVVLDYLDRKESEGFKEFILYCDNCAGQNKNRMVIGMCLYASIKFKIRIILRFLEVGHTQNEGDSVHAMIEKNSRHRDVWTHDDWVQVILTARTTKPYRVIDVQHSMVFDFKDFAGRFNWKKNSRGEQVRVSNIKEVCISHDLEGYILYKTSFSEPYDRIDIFEGKEKFDVTSFPLKKLYDGLQKIKGRKLKSMLALCNRNLIPKQHHYYYRHLEEIHQEQNSNQSDEDEFDGLDSDKLDSGSEC
ncbi:hypothetical protein QAD02_023799 [Eretmocerus hayati]|uniref:Uncharacterized protein n=1 Tax=Eretmocerus hayati TaxID=131215 RepID=A0ACC2PXK7_9HYME|nr:hypothetical protein QAD02_023799 [Eretmocerus hayati]